MKVTFKGTGGLGSFLGLMLNFLPLIVFLLMLVIIIRRLGKISLALKEVLEAIASNPRT